MRHSATIAASALVVISIGSAISTGTTLFEFLKKDYCSPPSKAEAAKIAEQFVKNRLAVLSVNQLTDKCLTRVSLGVSESEPVGDVYVLEDGITLINGTLHTVGDTIDVDLPGAKRPVSSASVQPTIPPAEPVTATPGQKRLLSKETRLPISKAADNLYNEIQALNSIQQEGGTPGMAEAYIFIDPFCSYCHKLFRSVDQLQALGLNTHWIPAAIGIHEDSLSVAAALYSPDNNEARWETLVSWMKTKSQTALPTPSDDDIHAIKENIHYLVQINRLIPKLGTPLLIYKSKSGEVVIHNGLPTPEQVQAMVAQAT